MAYDPGLVARIADLLPRAGGTGARRKNVFGGMGFMLGKSAAVIAWQDALLVKVPRDAYDEMRARPGVEPFAPGGESPMGTWLVVPSDAIADDPELVEWLQRGIRALRSPTAKRRKR